MSYYTCHSTMSWQCYWPDDAYCLQVLFLLYHYFEAREMYNAIRVFIAGYVWMTGYNNFSYYYKYKDFNIAR